jgi:hypothetical protein
LYLAQDAAGAGRSQLGSSDFSVGTSEYSFSELSLLPSFTHFVAYALSSSSTPPGAEQTPPAAFPIYDRSSTASGLSFPDMDLDFEEAGGTLSWDAPSDTSQVINYHVYLAADAAGANRTLFGNLTENGTNYALFFPVETSLLNYGA